MSKTEHTTCLFSPTPSTPSLFLQTASLGWQQYHPSHCHHHYSCPSSSLVSPLTSDSLLLIYLPRVLTSLVTFYAVSFAIILNRNIMAGLPCGILPKDHKAKVLQVTCKALVSSDLPSAGPSQVISGHLLSFLPHFYFYFWPLYTDGLISHFRKL